MRVIAGTARRLPLKTIEGRDTRPTTDRIKETLFNILQNEIYGCRFLDLFSGSGAIGIEALSRGAAGAVFVEQKKEAAACIRENLKFTRLEEGGEVLVCDVLDGLSRLEGRDPFQIIFMDPPYGLGQERRVLEYLAQRRPSYADPDTIILVEAAKGTDFSYVPSLGMEVYRTKEYKTNMHVFIRMQEQERK
ncbi:MAG TPA: 16S rRNA (guanine(966)-N(2))-methyltransferase RsmD [Candidatus Choladousia intestinigallinarum]|nr:16S rRNA (guanine(966)-N(2))-methyltransferase RsmD [Candidatus Choladousia intestinigallinarum]